MNPMTALALSSIAVLFSVSARAAVREVPLGISDAYLPRARANAEAVAVVNGLFQNGCYKWSRATVTDLPGALHEIRSYANVQSGMCIMVLVPFTKEIALGKLAAGTHRLRFVNGDGTYLEKQLSVE